MQDILNLVALVCAALASMGFGVYAAYALVKAAFALMHWHAQQAAPAKLKPATQIAPAS
jgi:hypothetical protein